MQRSTLLLASCLIVSCLGTVRAVASDIEYQHAYAFLSAPKYPEDFEHFDYVNPDAPVGGRLRVPSQGTWDNLNPILEGSKGRIVDGMGFWARDRLLVLDTLMTPSLDEPATYYGLLAEGVAFPDDLAWVAFKLREGIRWHDGTPKIGRAHV